MLVTLYKVNKKIDLCKRNSTKIYNTRTHVRDGTISVRKYYWEENSTVYEQHGEKAYSSCIQRTKQRNTNDDEILLLMMMMKGKNAA